MLNNILLHLLGILNTVIDGQTTQCEVSQHVLYLGPKGYIITIIEVTFLYSGLQRQPLVKMQNTHSHTELDTVPPAPAWTCPLWKFRSSLLHGAYQMHRFRRHTT